VRDVSLGELVTIAGGGPPSRERPEYFEGPIPWVTVKDLGSDFFIHETQEHISQAGLDGSASRLIPAGNVILATRMAVGRAVINKVEVAINQDLKALLCGASLHPTYLLFFLSHKAAYLEAKATGATVKGITIDEIESLEIPLPDLPEQQRVAGLLEQADRLRRTRRYALELSDTFLSATFNALFDDRKGEPGWPMNSLEDLADIVSGIAKGQKYGDKKTVEVPYLRVANVQDGYLNLTEIKRIPALVEDIEHLRLEPDDVVMTEGGDFDKLGRGAIWPGGIKDCIHQNHIFRVRLNQTRIRPVYFSEFLRSRYAKNYFLRCSKQTTNLASINMTQLRATPVPTPPIGKQNHFAALVAQHDRLRSKQREALRQAEHLFQSLLHRAFNGELTVAAEMIELQSSPEFIRTVLAAEIVDRMHGDRTFGQVKLQKVIHLVEYIVPVDEIASEPERFAAGPHDPKLIAQVEAKMRDCDWFEAVPRADGYGNEYRPLAKAGGHREHFEKLWPKQAATIRRLIDEMKTWKTERCERFATVYAAWNDLLHWEKPVTDSAILEEVLEHWHPDKLQIPKAKWVETLGWMRHEGYIPNRFGHPTAPKPQPELFSTGST
jgi:type I restriction enzyme S subunit